MFDGGFYVPLARSSEAISPKSAVVRSARRSEVCIYTEPTRRRGSRRDEGGESSGMRSGRVDSEARLCLPSNQAQSLAPPDERQNGSNVGAYVYTNRHRRGTRRPRTADDRRRAVYTIATTRGQEVDLIRGSEWQTGARLCPNGGTAAALHQGFEPDRRGRNAGAERGEGGGNTHVSCLVLDAAMIANLISRRSLISPEVGDALPPGCEESASARVRRFCGSPCFTCSFLSSARIHLTPRSVLLLFFHGFN